MGVILCILLGLICCILALLLAHKINALNAATNECKHLQWMLSKQNETIAEYRRALEEHNPLIDTYYLPGLNQLVKNIGIWRRKKGFSGPTHISEHSLINEKLMLGVTEDAEACEAVRDGNQDNFEEKMADRFIRWADLMDSMS